MARIVIAGCGDIGTAVGQRLVDNGHAVCGVRRSKPPANSRFPMLAMDLGDFREYRRLKRDVDLVLYTVTPSDRSDTAYRQVYREILQRLLDHYAIDSRPPGFLLVSSTSVYGQNAGEVVDESSPTRPENFRGRNLLFAENAVRGYDRRTCVVRFSGIYGPGRERLIRLARAGAAIQKDPPYFSNRIHREDCINLLCLLISRMIAGQAFANLYLASDRDPAPLWNVMSYVYRQLGIAGAVPQKPEDSSAGSNKRCLGKNLMEMDYRYLFPDYRAGYSAMIRT